MKFLCVPCDSPMKLQTVRPPEGGSLSVVYSCPECGYEMAMLTNPFETQLVQSLGVRIGPSTSWRPRRSFSGGGRVERREGERRGVRRGDEMPVPRDDGWYGRRVEAGPPASTRLRTDRRVDSRPVDVRRGSAAREHSVVRPPHGADRHRAIRPRARSGRS